MTRAWVRGRPLTFSWRSRQDSPLPLERVKRGAPGVGSTTTIGAGGGRTTGRPLTDCRWVHRRLPLPQERVKRGGALIRLTWRTLGRGTGPRPGGRGLCKGLPGQRALRNLSLGARKTPHLLLAKTPEFSSPLGEGEAARPFEEIDTDARPLGYARVSGEGARAAADPRTRDELGDGA